MPRRAARKRNRAGQRANYQDEQRRSSSPLSVSAIGLALGDVIWRFLPLNPDRPDHLTRLISGLSRGAAAGKSSNRPNNTMTRRRPPRRKLAIELPGPAKGVAAATANPTKGTEVTRPGKHRPGPEQQRVTEYRPAGRKQRRYPATIKGDAAEIHGRSITTIKNEESY
jgi:hypothetical protein